ncbi:MAG TPA: DUF2269 family protein [Candidatus Dormibacteraeota bacterium]|jgi:hypothetical protein|nr:DUF2269 family protein [Candidatus Dormibacteraeota bacterium]
MTWFHFWLFLHVTAAIIAFGPTFVFPLIGIAARNEPAHIGFALKLDAAIEDRLVIPFALTMLVSGIGLSAALSIDWKSNPWLTIGLVLYLVALFIAVFVQRPVVHRLIHLAAGMREPAPAGPGAAPAGPPVEFLRLIGRVRIFGMVLSGLLIAIIVLMVWKPGGNI